MFLYLTVECYQSRSETLERYFRTAVLSWLPYVLVRICRSLRVFGFAMRTREATHRNWEGSYVLCGGAIVHSVQKDLQVAHCVVGCADVTGAVFTSKCHAAVMYARQCVLVYCCTKATACAVPTVTNLARAHFVSADVFLPQIVQIEWELLKVLIISVTPFCRCAVPFCRCAVPLCRCAVPFTTPDACYRFL